MFAWTQRQLGSSFEPEKLKSAWKWSGLLLPLIMVYLYLVRDTRSHTCSGHLINGKLYSRVGEVKWSMCKNEKGLLPWGAITPTLHGWVITISLSAPLCVLAPHSSRLWEDLNCLQAASPHSLYALHVKLCHRLDVFRSHENAVLCLLCLVQSDRRKVQSRLIE